MKLIFLKQFYLPVIFIICCNFSFFSPLLWRGAGGEAFSQTKFTISGTIKEAKNGEGMIGATIFVKELPGTGSPAEVPNAFGTQAGAATNAYGFYSITLPEGKYTLSAQFLGCDQKDSIIELNQNIKLNLELAEKSTTLKEVEISSEKMDKNVTSTQMSMEKMNVKEISAIPVIFGEKDILKTIQLLPGIKGVADGNSGFYVRGGGADQNLILLDEATVYNPSHLLGFFSVFNSDAIKDVTIFKGGIPAEYGGRISSALDIKMNDGNSKKFSMKGGIGLIASRLTVEAPINKGKGSFIVSGRRTYADVFLKLSSNKTLKNSSLYFYDFNVKANYQLGEKDRIFLSGYFGRDNFGFSSGTNANRSFGIDWGNATGTLRENHIFNNKLFLNSSLVFTNYNYNVVLGAGDAQFKITSGIRDFGLKEDFQYFISTKHKLKFGVNVIDHTFTPGEITINTSSTTNAPPARLPRTIERKHAMEYAAYASTELVLTERLTVNYGLRYSMFSAIGPSTIYHYDEFGAVTDSSVYEKNQNIKTYGGLEPRISAVYMLNETNSIKSSYNHIYQYLHLLQNSTTSTPFDLWIPCSSIVQPQVGDQVALGYFKNLKQNMYETSVEVYYKNMQNQIDYVPGANLLFNRAVETQLVFGRGWAYGSEFFVKKKYGKLNGWIGYTLARTLRKFDGTNPANAYSTYPVINNGNVFPARQDIIHDVSLVSIYKLNEKWTFSATFVYRTGFAATFPSGKYIIDGKVTSVITERNGYRMPPYHRMDVGVTMQGKKTEKYESSWNFSCYNIYGRQNPFSITSQPDPNNPNKTQMVQLSLFRWVPSITYNFNF